MEDTKRGSDPQRGVDNRGVVLFGVWLGVSGIAISIGIWGLFRLLESGQERRDQPLPPQVAASFRRTPPEPRLEPDPLALRRALRVQEDARLSTYGWVDRAGGVVHIPIGRAMEIIARQGVPGGKPLPSGIPAPAASPAVPGRPRVEP